MSDKKKESETAPEQANSLNEMEQLRLLVFGQAQERLVTQIETLRQDSNNALRETEKNLTEHISKMKSAIEQQFVEMDNRLKSIDASHDENEVNLQKSIDSLASEHEMLVASTAEDFKNMEQILNTESDSLSSNFNEQLEDLKIYLDEVSKELTSSKTDRKTLARLLATMATNLEDDQI